MFGFTRWLDGAVADVQRGLYLLALLIFLVLALIIIILVVIVWDKFTSLPPGAKVLVMVAVGIVGLIFALIVGWVAEQAIVTAWEAALRFAVHCWRLFDGFTRTYPWIGMVLLALLPVVFISLSNEE